MRRNPSPHSPLTWSVTILLTWATFVRLSDSRTITCNVSSVVEGDQATLTCDYGGKMFTESSGKEIIVEHYSEDGSFERVVDCYWRDGASSYTCPRGPPGWEKLKVSTAIDENMGRLVTLEFPAKKSMEGKYYCKTTGAGFNPTSCNLNVTDRETTTCKVPSVEEGDLATLTCDYRDKNNLQQFSVDHYFEDGSSERILDCSQKDRASSPTCQKKEGVEFQIENDRQHVKVRFKASKDKEGAYYCKTPGISSAACCFAEDPGITIWEIVAIMLILIIVALVILVAFMFYYIRLLYYKQVVVSNAIESLISIVCSMKIMNEKLEPERVEDAQKLVTMSWTGFWAEVTDDLHPIMARLWNDPNLQGFIDREAKNKAKNRQQDSGVYFLDSLDRITAPNYKPTKEDVDKTWVKLDGASKTSFTIQAFHQRLMKPQNSTAEGAAPDLARETDHLLSGSEKTQLA